jgi:hypothetical protein
MKKNRDSAFNILNFITNYLLNIKGLVLLSKKS